MPNNLLGPAIVAQDLGGQSGTDLSAVFQLMQQRQQRERQSALDKSLINSRMVQNQLAPSLISQRTAATDLSKAQATGIRGRESRAAGLHPTDIKLAKAQAKIAEFEALDIERKYNLTLEDEENVKQDMVVRRAAVKRRSDFEIQLFEAAKTGDSNAVAAAANFANQRTVQIAEFRRDPKKAFNKDPYIAWATGFGTHKVASKNEPALDVIGQLYASDHRPILRDFLIDNAGTAMIDGMEIDPKTNIPQVAAKQQRDWLKKATLNLANVFSSLTPGEADIAVEDTISKVPQMFGITEGTGPLKIRTDQFATFFGGPQAEQTFTGLMQDIFQLQENPPTDEEISEILSPQIADSLGLSRVTESIKKELAKGTPAIDIKRAEQKKIKEKEREPFLKQFGKISPGRGF